MGTGHRSFIGVPPDAAGKQLETIFVTELDYENATRDFIVGETVNGQDSGTIAIVVRSDPVTSTTGIVHVFIDPDSDSSAFTNDENVRDINNVVIAKVDNSESRIYYQSINISGGNNPFNKMSVDTRGAAYVRYPEGSQQSSAFGLSRVANPELMLANSFTYNSGSSAFTTSTIGSGSFTHLADERAMAMDVGTASTDYISRTQLTFPTFQSGVGTLIKIALSVGDSGKTDVIRRWGYYDGYQGIFFELDGTDLYIVSRSSTSGSMVDTRVAQANWNADILDGSFSGKNVSGFNIDVSKVNLYWFDVRWAGTSVMRAGVWSDGVDRFVAHKFSDVNIDTRPILTSGNLPVRFEQFNTGTSVSPSRLKVYGTTIFSDGTLIKDQQIRVSRFVINNGPVTVFDGYDTPLMTIRAGSTVSGFINRKRLALEQVSIFVENEPILFQLYVASTLDTEDFEKAGPSLALDVDKTATQISGGRNFFAFMAPVGVTNFDIHNFFSVVTAALTTDAFGSPGSKVTFTAQSLTSGQTANVLIYASLVEVD